ncbi:MAG: DUF58 domain-containing protein [Lentisphaerae bacterium]|nr:DUF58 domain-containing protein [Lentisphaerota bacterium]
MAEASPSVAQVTSLFGNDILQLLERMRINSSRRFTNRAQGEHLTSKGGSSNEFADYRNYVEGDDVRYVDWNIFARLNRPYMKTYHHEEELHVVLLLDASQSMAFEGKLTLVRQLAAAFGIMGLLSGERVSCWCLNGGEGGVTQLAPGRGRGSMGTLLNFIEGVEPGGDMPIESGVEHCLRKHRGRGVAVLLSDFLTFGDVPRAMNSLFSKGLETLAVQVLGPTELDPDLTSDVRLVDCELGTTLDVTGIGSLIDLYHEYRLALEGRLVAACTSRGGRFLSLDASADLRWILADLLRRKGWVR